MATPTPPTFAGLLRGYRLEADLTQERLAERAGLSVRGIQDLERGAARPLRDTRVRLARALALVGDRLARFEAAATPTPRHRSTGGMEPAGSNLPASLTRFIGRERELAEVQALLGRARLVTLTGTGGVGKTRLALELAAGLADRYADGVWLVELAALTDAALVPQAIAATLGIPGAPGRPLVAALIAGLHDRRVLLLLDNCEHLIDACASLAAALLRGCPAPRLLATSREPLRIPGEAIYRVPPLSLPGAALDGKAAPASEAVQLFLDRTASAHPSFVRTSDHVTAVAQICRRLDGIPLALELAAAQAAALGVAQLGARLDDCFRSLTTGTRAAWPHQRTLAATIDWSHALLAPAERALFRRLAVFAGGWTLEAAEVVCAGEGIAGDAVLDLLVRVVEKSLAVVDEADGATRYRLLEPLRQYAAERLRDDGEHETLRRRHAAYFATLATAAATAVVGAQQAAWLEQLEREHDNLRAALTWAIECGESEAGLRLGATLGWFWAHRGYWTEGRERLAAVLALPDPATEIGLRAGVLTSAGILAHLQGDFAVARVHLEAGLAAARQSGADAATAVALEQLGVVARLQGEDSAARALTEEALAIARRVGRPELAPTILEHLGLILSAQGDYAAARGRLDESLTGFRALSQPGGVARALVSLGMIARAQGDLGAAERSLAEGLAAYRLVGDRWGIAVALGNLGVVAQQRGDAGSAVALYRESLRIRRALGDQGGIATLLEGFAGVAAARAQSERALRLAGAAAALRSRHRIPPAALWQRQLERWLEPARQALDARAQVASWAAGQAMAMDQALMDVEGETPA